MSLTPPTHISLRTCLRVAALLAFAAGHTDAQNLQDSSLELPGVYAGDAAWGDYDADGDADLVLIGEITQANGTCLRIARVLRNDGGFLVEDASQSGRLIGVYGGAADWADIDSDGDLDLAIAGWDENGDESLRLYLSDDSGDGGTRLLTFDTRQNAEALTGVRYANLAWGDVDRDGDLDLIVTGMDANGSSSTRLYSNDRGLFRLDELNSDALLNVHGGDVAWADYDNDGDLDLALAGENVHPEGGIRRVTEFYTNEPTGTLSLNTGLTSAIPVTGGGLAWGDYDNDGNPDLAQSGRTEAWDIVTQLYLNRPAGTLTADPAFALNTFLRIDGQLDWVDYDNDGDLDLAASGRTILSDRRAFVFENRDGAVSGVSAESSVEGLAGGSTLWGDYDGDGRADLLLTGVDGDGTRRTVLYTNSVSTPNRLPDPPAALNRVTVTSQRVLFSWPAAVDLESPVLSYNIRLGSEAGLGDILSATAPVRAGNAGFKTSYVLDRPLAPDTYFWSVQSVDGGLARSAFASEGQFVVGQFVSSDQSLRGMTSAAMTWGDADGDGDADLVLMGTNRSGEAQTLAYVNRTGRLTLDSESGLSALTVGAVAWGDYDGDGDLDLFSSGRVAEGNRGNTLYNVSVPISDSLVFEPALSFRPELDASAATWGDVDLDGDLDLVYAGQSASVEDGVQLSFTQVWRNDGDGAFSQGTDALVGVNNGDLALGDSDGDGDLDLLVTGVDSNGQRRADLYQNDLTDGFASTEAGLPGVESSDVALGDYDRDGDLDLVLSGITVDGDNITQLFDNEAGSFTRNELALPGIRGGDLLWADYDNDQDVDLILSGNNGSTAILEVWENTIGQTAPADDFERVDDIPILAGVDFSAIAMADPDGDGDLDLISSGRSLAQAPSTVVNDNLTAQQGNANNAPVAPTGLAANDSADEVTFSWNEGSDDGAPPAANLTYQLRVGTTPGGHDIVSGARALTRGNVGHALSQRLTGLASGTYFWTVQTVDAGASGSAFANEQIFVIDTVAPTVASTALQEAGAGDQQDLVIGLGQTVTLALELFDEHSGMSNAVPPAVTATVGGQQLALTQLQFTGSTWNGELTIADATPSGSVTIAVNGAVDGKGNVLTPFEAVDAFRIDSERPQVASRVPAQDADLVDAGQTALQVVFSEPLDAATVTETAFSLRRGRAEVSVTPVYDAETNAVSLNADLLPGSEYTLSVGATVADVAGNRLLDAPSWSFRTRIPSLLTEAVVPAADGSDVAVANGRVQATFDTGILAGVLAVEGAVQLRREGVAVELTTPIYDSETRTLVFEPTQGLRPGSRYEVVLSSLFGGPLRALSDDGDYRWSFTTAQPELLEPTPADGDSLVRDLSAALVARFDGGVDLTVLADDDAIEVLAEGAEVDIDIAQVLFDQQENSLVIPLPAGLTPGTRYQVSLSGQLGGPQRVADEGNYSWNFSTAVPNPVVLQPADGDSGVAVTTPNLSVQFDSDIDRAALPGAVQVFMEGSAIDIGTPVFDNQTRTLTIVPANGLRAGSSYRIQVSSAIRGPRADDDVSWTFATLVPRVVSTDPADGASIQAGPRRLQVAFSSAVDDNRLRRGFRLSQSGRPIDLRADEFLYDAENFIVSLPSVDLVSGTQYRLTVLSRVGGPRAQTEADSDISFITDVPTVTGTQPSASAEGVSTTQATLRAEFSGPIAQRDGGGFSLRARSLARVLTSDVDVPFQVVPVTGFGTDSTGTVVNFAPEGGLADFTEYEVTIASDVFGDLGDQQFTWRFHTAARLADAASGGTLTSGDRAVEIYLPPNALATNGTEIRIEPVDEPVAGKAAGAAQGDVQVGRAFRLDASGAQLSKPATLTMRYTTADLGGANATRLGIFALDGGSWRRVGGTWTAGAVRTSIDGFGTFALFEDLSTGVGSTALSAIDCQPRAFAPEGGALRDETDISFDLSTPADVTVRVYNAAGRLERVVTRDQPMAPGRNSLPWDGLDENSEPVASGLYVVVVSAGDAQAEKIVAVVR